MLVHVFSVNVCDQKTDIVTLINIHEIHACLVPERHHKKSKQKRETNLNRLSPQHDEMFGTHHKKPR
jgi:hypothetical protein